ncbi:hypothetical protein ALC57_07333 [Trachymyrmex cornetzi]|uniref:Uncharacterized protein n=1 Tax=Trachymyrmex cornetzi TaxID=471704 RepID=A0A195E5J1_9HYME|nr:hypothetical protein ALC57_07333 [Trachymyrmex cornetzi]
MAALRAVSASNRHSSRCWLISVAGNLLLQTGQVTHSTVSIELSNLKRLLEVVFVSTFCSVTDVENVRIGMLHMGQGTELFLG